jgi:release factor glutamine methyltransferase
MPPETVGSAIARAVSELQAACVDAPRLTAEVLLAHVLGWERTRVLGHMRDDLDPDFQAQFQALVRRCAAGEPLHYLTGEREFYGLSFQVTPAVLIPRPETEILVEKAVELARTRAGSLRFVDVGTGSGCIAISLAHELPGALGWATDVSQSALVIAKQNARRAGVGDRVRFICCDLLECFPARPYFDFILSNPPYVSRAEMEALPRLVREHEPNGALYGGASGFEAYRRLLPQAAQRLAAAGCLLLEIGAGQAAEIAKIVREAGLTLTETIQDLQSIPRCLVARRGESDCRSQVVRL